MHTFTHTIGFPPARTDIWVVGGNGTLSWTGSAPEFNTSGTFNFPRVADVTCGGLVSCNVTVTVSGVPVGWTLMLLPNPCCGPTPLLPNGSTFLYFGAESRCGCIGVLGWYSYDLTYVNYPVNGAPPITVTWNWVA